MAETEREAHQQVKSFVQYACVIALTLESKEQDTLVLCKNGRSRSPSVMAAFFVLFRGYQLGSIQEWFRCAYREQRPATHAVSNRFPNFERFARVLEKIAKGKDPQNEVEYKLVRGRLRYMRITVVCLTRF